jgi:hypothetical protein
VTKPASSVDSMVEVVEASSASARRCCAGEGEGLALGVELFGHALEQHVDLRQHLGRRLAAGEMHARQHGGISAASKTPSSARVARLASISRRASASSACAASALRGLASISQTSWPA